MAIISDGISSSSKVRLDHFTMMEYEEYENPAAIGEDTDGENNVGQPEDTEMMMDDEDIPVTQEDAWAVIR